MSPETRLELAISSYSSKYIGKIRVNYDNVNDPSLYATVCGDNFTAAEADVMCRMLGVPTSG